MRVLTTLAVGGSPLPGMMTTSVGLPWQAAAILSALGLTAATALAWRMETNRQARYLCWVRLVEKKVGQGQSVNLNSALEDVLAPQRQVADPNPRRGMPRRRGAAREVEQQ